MENYSTLCENLNLDNLVINKDGKPELTPEGIEKASLFSEGNKYLFDAISSCWKHGIKTFACCSGHEGKDDHEDSNYFPYMGLMLDNNSLPYVRNIIANLQDTKDVTMNVRFNQKEDEWAPNEPDFYKSFYVHCALPNRCEVFYKIYEALEARNMEKEPLSKNDQIGTSASEFYNQVEKFTKEEPMPEKTQKLIGHYYDNNSQEFNKFTKQVTWSKTRWQKIKESKMIRSIAETLNPRKKNERIAMEKYEVAQNEYEPPYFNRLNNSYYNGQTTQAEQTNEPIVNQPLAQDKVEDSIEI